MTLSKNRVILLHENKIRTRGCKNNFANSKPRQKKALKGKISVSAQGSYVVIHVKFSLLYFLCPHNHF